MDPSLCRGIYLSISLLYEEMKIGDFFESLSRKSTLKVNYGSGGAGVTSEKILFFFRTEKLEKLFKNRKRYVVANLMNIKTKNTWAAKKNHVSRKKLRSDWAGDYGTSKTIKIVFGSS